MDSQFISAVAVVAIGTIANGIISAGILVLTGQEVPLLDGLTSVILPLAIVNALFSPVIYMPVSWFRQPERSPVLGSGRLTSPL
jgi:hypothetical protein